MLTTIKQVANLLHSITANYTFEYTSLSASYFKLNGKRFNLPVARETILKEVKVNERDINHYFG